MSSSESFVITGARVFDGERVLDRVDVAVENGTIAAVAADYPTTGRQVIDGTGATLLPGLIDSHTHPADDALALAIKFGGHHRDGHVHRPRTARQPAAARR